MTPHHDAAAQRFTLPTTPPCVLDYTLAPGVARFTHTGVPVAYQGQGLAAALVEAGLGWARDQGLKVQPDCSYVHTYIQRHPAWHSLLA